MWFFTRLAHQNLVIAHPVHSASYVPDLILRQETKQKVLPLKTRHQSFFPRKWVTFLQFWTWSLSILIKFFFSMDNLRKSFCDFCQANASLTKLWILYSAILMSNFWAFFFVLHNNFRWLVFIKNWNTFRYLRLCLHHCPILFQCQQGYHWQLCWHCYHWWASNLAPFL